MEPGQGRADRADRAPHLAAHAGRPDRAVCRGARARRPHAGAAVAGGRTAAGRQARAPDRMERGGPGARGKSPGVAVTGAPSQAQRRGDLQPVHRTRHADRRGAPSDQRPRRADDQDAVAAPISQAFESGSGNRGRPPRAIGRHGLSQAAARRGTEPAGTDDGDCRHLRSADRAGPAVQERQDALGSHQDHGADAARQPYRRRTVRAVPVFRDLPPLRRAVPASFADRRGQSRRVARQAHGAEMPQVRNGRTRQRRALPSSP